MAQTTFSVYDYIVLGIFLMISIGIGLYEAFTGGKNKTIGEYMVANRKMWFLPVAASLFASFISPVTLVGMPADTYQYGSQVMWIALAPYIAIPITAFFFMPVYYNQRLTSTYEYLHMRFNSYSVRLSAGIIFSVTMALYMGVVLYGPSLAFDQVTGLPWEVSAVVIAFAGTLYTTLGGMKAVLWTDTFQSLIIFAGVITVIVRGLMLVGGVSEAWRLVEEGRRIEFFNFDPNPTTRMTFWAAVIGFTFTWLNIFGTNQAEIQRALSCKTLTQARIAYFCAMVGIATIHSLACTAGLLIFAHYRDCDPLASGTIKKADQLLPQFAMEMLSFIPGLPGLVFGCVCSGTLSTISSGLNSMATVVVIDVVKKKWPDISESRATLISKALSCIFGIVVLAVTFLCHALGEANVLTLFNKLTGVPRGALLGLFVLGIFIPWTNWKGALAGLFVGLLASGSVVVGSVVSQYKPVKLPTSIAGCNVTSMLEPNFTTLLMTNFTLTTAANAVNPVTLAFTDVTTAVTSSAGDPTANPNAHIFPLFRISHMYYTPLGAILTVLVGVLVSLLTGPTKRGEVHSALLCPLYRRCNCCNQYVIDDQENKYKVEVCDGPSEPMYEEESDAERNKSNTCIVLTGISNKSAEL